MVISAFIGLIGLGPASRVFTYSLLVYEVIWGILVCRLLLLGVYLGASRCKLYWRALALSAL